MTSDAPHPHPHGQSKYQVRFDWGVDGAERIATGADIVVWVDVLGESDATDAAVIAAVPSVPEQAEVVAGGLTDAAAVAAHVLEAQVRLGRRAFIAVIAAGDAEGESAASLRFAVEDLLGAGAVIDALAAVGLDYCSPEAAAACAAFTGLRGAVTHLATASASAQALIASGVAPQEIRAAATLAVADAVRVLRPYPA